MTKRILICDDDPVIRVLLSDYLVNFGFQVDSVETGVQCLDRVHKQPPDVLLLDFQMPVMNGLEVLNSIRRDGRTRDLAVIMLSANKDTEKLVQASGIGADLYIVKPFEIATIIPAIEQIAKKTSA